MQSRHLEKQDGYQCAISPWKIDGVARFLPR
jgi:hypothetical protein